MIIDIKTENFTNSKSLDSVTNVSCAQGNDWASCRDFTGFGQRSGIWCGNCSYVTNQGPGDPNLCKKDDQVVEELSN